MTREEKENRLEFLEDEIDRIESLLAIDPLPYELDRNSLLTDRDYYKKECAELVEELYGLVGCPNCDLVYNKNAMSHDCKNSVWVLFGANTLIGFPNFFPIMISDNADKLRELAKTLPDQDTTSYQLFQLPKDQMLAGYSNYTKRFEGQLGRQVHEHLNERDYKDEED